MQGKTVLVSVFFGGGWSFSGWSIWGSKMKNDIGKKVDTDRLVV